jgi:RHS repeat-associated protein
LLALSDNGFVSNYWYDAAGERTVKESGDTEGVFVNGVLSGGRTGTANFTAYISPYLNVRNGGEYTKHIYMGSQRITSKVSDSGIFGTSPVNTTDLKPKYTAQTAALKLRYDSLGVQYKGVEKSGSIVSSSSSGLSASYFYHSDHLGSSSLITDVSGEIVQHVEYVPFGGTFIDERRSLSSWHTPFLFSGKERDEETGLLYVSQRYQDEKYGIWYSVDPLAEKYPNVSSYVYCYNNPVKFVDPDGREGLVVSGQPGPHKNREHFLINGLDRSKGALAHRQSKSEKVSWIVYNDGSKENGYTKETLAKYQKLAKEAGVTMKVVSNTDDIINYVNNKNGGNSRENDKITSFYYVGHATPGDLDAGYTGGFGGQDFDPDNFDADAFAKGCWVNVTAACRTSKGGIIENSVVDQFVKKLDPTSTVNGSNVRTQFDGGKRTDSELLKANNGAQVVKKGENND